MSDGVDVNARLCAELFEAGRAPRRAPRTCRAGHDLTLPDATYHLSGACRICCRAATQRSKDARAFNVLVHPREQPGNPQLTEELTGLSLQELSARCSAILEGRSRR